MDTLVVCQWCETVYDWHRSTSRWLRMTFCCEICEVRANGATIDDLINLKRDSRPLVRWLRQEYRKAHPELEVMA